jgi:hypothetical protein
MLWLPSRVRAAAAPGPQANIALLADDLLGFRTTREIAIVHAASDVI